MKVVVAGATFGRVYAEGVLRSRHDLVGILGRGGEASKALAEKAGVPCYSSVEAIPDCVDLACVVVRSGIVGGPGSELAEALIGRRISVVQEQPVHQSELVRLASAAKEKGVGYAVNAFYPYLKPVSALVSAAKEIREREEILCIEATTSLHVAYPFVNVLGRLTGGLRPFLIERGFPIGSFEHLSGSVSGIPVSIMMYNEICLDDPDNYAPAYMRFRIYSESGVLSLNDVFGPLLWTPRLHVERSSFEECIGGRVEVIEESSLSHKEMVSLGWAQGISAMLDAFERDAGDPSRLQYQITSCGVWQDLTSRFAPASARQRTGFEPLSAETLVKSKKGIEL